MTRAQVRGFIESLAAQNPAPETELLFADPFTLLVAVVLSAQATDVSVNRATATLFQDAPHAGGDGASWAWRASPRTSARSGCGRARRATWWNCRGSWWRQHGGQVPRDREALETLPGVGRKTANVVLNVAFGESTMAVDTHIFRLGNRTGIAPGKTPREVEDGAAPARAAGAAARRASLADPARPLCVQGAACRSAGAASPPNGAAIPTRRRSTRPPRPSEAAQKADGIVPTAHDAGTPITPRRHPGKSVTPGSSVSFPAPWCHLRLFSVISGSLVSSPAQAGDPRLAVLCRAIRGSRRPSACAKGMLSPGLPLHSRGQARTKSDQVQ